MTYIGVISYHDTCLVHTFLREGVKKKKHWITLIITCVFIKDINNLQHISLGKLNVVNNLKYKNYKTIEGFSGENKVEDMNGKELQKDVLEKVHRML